MLGAMAADVGRTSFWRGSAVLLSTQSCLVVINDFYYTCLIGLNFLFSKMGIATLGFADLEGYIMARRDNRHEILKVLTPRHFTIIFNRQQCGVKEKALSFGVRQI